MRPNPEAQERVRFGIIHAPNKTDNEYLSFLNITSAMTLLRGGLTEKVPKGLKGNEMSDPEYKTEA